MPNHTKVKKKTTLKAKPKPAPSFGNHAQPEIASPQFSNDISSMSQGEILHLQRTIGNQAVLRMVTQAQHPELTLSPAIQRDLMSYQDFRTNSAVPRRVRSTLLKTIDRRLKRWHVHRGLPEHNFGLEVLGKLSDAIVAWQDAKSPDNPRRPTVLNLQNEVAAELPIVNEMAQIRQDIQANYGITLDNRAGERAIRRFYLAQGASRRVLRGLTQTRWSIDELRGVQTSLERFSPLLGANRDGALGAQTITTFSRLTADITTDLTAIEGQAPPGGGARTPLSTFAETFTQRVGGRNLSNISLFDHAGSVMDFVADPANPTPAELQKGFIGTVTHELSHGLIEMLPAPAGAPAWPLPGGALPGAVAPPVRNMLEHYTNQMTFWTDRNTPSGTAGAEAPITGYGQTSSAEDLAEAVMFYFEDPVRLQGTCPTRYDFINNNLTQFLNAGEVARVQAEVAAANAPPAPPAPEGDPNLGVPLDPNLQNGGEGAPPIPGMPEPETDEEVTALALLTEGRPRSHTV